MKKYLSLFIVLLMAFSISTSVVRAESGSGSNEGGPRFVNPLKRGEIKEKKDEIKADWEAKREEMKAKIEVMREEAKAKMEALRENIKGEKDAAKLKIKELRVTGREKALERFDGVIKRMTALSNKISEHIAKLELKGVNVTDAKSFLATAQEKLDAADAKTAEVNALLATSIDELSAENKTKLRTLTKETQALIKEAHLALKNAVKSLKENIKIKREETKSSDDSNEVEDDSQKSESTN